MLVAEDSGKELGALLGVPSIEKKPLVSGGIWKRSDSLQLTTPEASISVLSLPSGIGWNSTLPKARSTVLPSVSSTGSINSVEQDAQCPVGVLATLSLLPKEGTGLEG